MAKAGVDSDHHSIGDKKRKKTTFAKKKKTSGHSCLVQPES
jgi:hypothetical protein